MLTEEFRVNWWPICVVFVLCVGLCCCWCCGGDGADEKIQFHFSLWQRIRGAFAV